MTTMWKVAYGQAAPKEVLAKVPSYPHRDEDGEQIYENTHFTNQDIAWRKHIAENLAGLKNITVTVLTCRADLARVEASCVNAALAYTNTLNAHRDYEARKQLAHD